MFAYSWPAFAWTQTALQAGSLLGGWWPWAWGRWPACEGTAWSTMLLALPSPAGPGCKESFPRSRPFSRDRLATAPPTFTPPRQKPLSRGRCVRAASDPVNTTRWESREERPTDASQIHLTTGSGVLSHLLVFSHVVPCNQVGYPVRHPGRRHEPRRELGT